LYTAAHAHHKFTRSPVGDRRPRVKRFNDGPTNSGNGRIQCPGAINDNDRFGGRLADESQIEFINCIFRFPSVPPAAMIIILYYGCRASRGVSGL